MKGKLNGIPATIVMHRRDCFARYGYWNETLPEWGDFDMWVRIVAGTGCLGYLSLPTCLHFRANWRKISNVTSRLMAAPSSFSSFPHFHFPPGRIIKESDWVVTLRLRIW